MLQCEAISLRKFEALDVSSMAVELPRTPGMERSDTRCTFLSMQPLCYEVETPRPSTSRSESLLLMLLLAAIVQGGWINFLAFV